MKFNENKIDEKVSQTKQILKNSEDMIFNSANKIVEMISNKYIKVL